MVRLPVWSFTVYICLVCKIIFYLFFTYVTQRQTEVCGGEGSSWFMPLKAGKRQSWNKAGDSTGLPLQVAEPSLH